LTPGVPAAPYGTRSRFEQAVRYTVKPYGDTAPGTGPTFCPIESLVAYGGACTAGKREDFDHYHEVLAWGLAHGQRRASA
jgi:hypothetical protein